MARAEGDVETIKVSGMARLRLGEIYRLSDNLSKASEYFDDVEKKELPYSDDVIDLARCGKTRVLLAAGNLEKASTASEREGRIGVGSLQRGSGRARSCR